jgi:putative hydrolases of HD superfamily
MDSRLEKQLAFIVEIDKLKNILRRTYLTDSSRRENSAEHSWHLGIMSFLLSEYSPENLNMVKVMKMVLIHDIVEIDAGDTFLYDAEGQKDKVIRENKAAERIFGILPQDLSKEMINLWEEYERGDTPEALYAAALDRLQPLLHNYITGGITWRKNAVRRSMVIEKNKHTAKGAPKLWEYARVIIDKSVEKGFLLDG